MTVTIAAMPAYNEANAIADIILGCKNYVDKVVVVDDGSSDNTAVLAESLGAYVVRHETYKGYGAALRDCFETAKKLDASAMVIIDADGQHDPHEIPKLLNPISQGFDLVIGSRFVNGNGKNVPNYQKMGMKVLDIVTVIAGGPHVTDSQSGFRAYGRKAIENIHLNGAGMSAGSEILLQVGDHRLKYTEVEIQCRYDLENCSSQNPFIHGPKVLFQLLKDMEYRKPLHYFTIPGLFMWISGMFMGLKFLQNFYLGRSLSFGSTVLMTLLSIVGLFLIFTGVILHAISEMINNNHTKTLTEAFFGQSIEEDNHSDIILNTRKKGSVGVIEESSLVVASCTTLSDNSEFQDILESKSSALADSNFSPMLRYDKNAEKNWLDSNGERSAGKLIVNAYEDFTK